MAWVVQECWGHATSQWVGDDVSTCTSKKRRQALEMGKCPVLVYGIHKLQE